jgi:hypothetical protein
MEPCRIDRPQERPRGHHGNRSTPRACAASRDGQILTELGVTEEALRAAIERGIEDKRR